MEDRGDHGEGGHNERDVAVPAVPRPRLVVVEIELVLGGLEGILDGAAPAFHSHSRERLIQRAPSREGYQSVGDVTPLEQPSVLSSSLFT